MSEGVGIPAVYDDVGACGYGEGTSLSIEVCSDTRHQPVVLTFLCMSACERLGRLYLAESLLCEV